MIGSKISRNWKKFWFLYLTLIIILAKQFVWSAFVPIFHTPDEQSHFAQSQWLGEKGYLPVDPAENLSLELELTETLLGVKRDNMGNNQFTYHPEYNIPYGKNLEGPKEKVITAISKNARTKYNSAEASGYPPLYYLIANPLYKITQDGSIIDRVFSLRLFPIFLLLIFSLIAWRIGLEVFQNQKAAIVLMILVAFQPMVSFVAAGIHPDNLLNVLSSVVLLISALMIKKGFKWKYLILGLICIYAGLQTKQFMFFVGPPFIALSALLFFKNPFLKWVVFVLILLSPALAFVFLLPITYMPQVTPNSPLYSMTFINYLQFRLPRLVFEMNPWYWGVFKWLGLTLNPLVMKIIVRTMGVAIVGLTAGYVLRVLKKKFGQTEKITLFFLIASIAYIGYMFVWDWRLMQANGFSIGIQGRYLFPFVIAHMAIILYGLTNLFRFKLQNVIYLIIALGAITLNISALNTVLQSYYDLSSINTFISQASQYKPILLKGENLKVLLYVGLFSLCVYIPLLCKVVLFDGNKNKQNN